MRAFPQIMLGSARLGGSRLLARLRHGEDGFLLVEVMMSALLVALIVTATFNGFDVAQRITLDQRRHSEAELLAAESQEQMRSDSATTLDALETTTHSYSREIVNNGTTTIYNISQEAKALSSKGSTGCSATGASRENGTNIEIISSVTWSELEKLKRPPVRVASVVTPPTGSALEVDVTDGGSPAKAESGVTAVVKFTPAGGSTATTVEGTTGSAGCVVFTGLASTSATVEIVEKLGWVTKGGELKYQTKTVTIAPNITTQYPVVYAPGGRLIAQFTYKGATTWSGKSVRDDTFVVSNSGIPVTLAQWALGATSFTINETGEFPYLGNPAATGAGYLNEGSATATATKYPAGDLFPFSSEWTVFAGDCPKNNVAAADEAKGTVIAGEGHKVLVPTSLFNLSLKKGTWAAKGTEADPTVYEVVTRTPECEGYEKLPNHSYAVSLKHKQKTGSGELENPFQPFGKQEICLFNATTKKTYRASFNLTTEAGLSATIYTEQPSKAERESIELPAREKRETEEREATKAREKREAEEAAMKTARIAREATEASERKMWEAEEKCFFCKQITKAEREAKEKTQTEARKAKEAEEAAKKAERTAAETKATSEKTTRVEAETAATKAREKAEKEEKEFEEPTEGVGWKVASGQTSC